MDQRDEQQPAIRYSIGEPPQPTRATPPRTPLRERRIRLGVAAAAAVAIILAGAGIWAITRSGDSFGSINVHGSITLRSGAYNFGSGTSACSAADGFNDISAGTAVLIGDQTGATIAVGQLQPGHLAQAGAGCSFDFDVKAPGGRLSYTVTISHRGTQVFSPLQMQEADMVLG